MSNKKLAIVTGGSGFIGGSVVDGMQKSGKYDAIHIFDVAVPNFTLAENVFYHRIDVTDPISLLKCCQRITANGEKIVIWADNVGLLGTNEDVELGSYPATAVNTNVLGFMNQVEVAEMMSVPVMLHQSKPVFASDYENTYTATKKQAELVARWAHNKHNINIIMLIYFNAVGCRQHIWPIRKLFPLNTVLALLDIDLTVFGTGRQLIDMIHVEDLVSASLLAAENEHFLGKDIRTYDLATGQAISVLDYATRLLELSKSNSEIQLTPMRPGEIVDSEIRANSEDIQYLKDELGFVVKHEIDDVIWEYIEYWAKGDSTEIYNALKYYMDVDKPFRVNGQDITMDSITVEWIESKLASKRELLGIK